MNSNDSAANNGEHKIQDLFLGIRGLAVKILNRVERTDAYLEKLLDNEIKSFEISGQDKALLYEIVHGVVRWQGRLDWILSGFYKGQFSKALPVLKNSLRVALYQLLFLDKIPEYAAVNEAVDFVKKLQGQKQADISNAILRNIIKNKNSIRYPDAEQDLIGFLSTYYSHPSWMVKRWLNRLGRQSTEALLLANNERPFITLRVNTLKISIEEFKNQLASVNLKYLKTNQPDFLKLTHLSNITHWKCFADGFFTVQDESTAYSVLLLDAQPGMRILDLCAAPGGKSSFIASIINNKGEIIALDRFESRLKNLKLNVDRLGVTCVKTKEIDALEYQDENLFDRVIVDVPCSGLGTLSKKPDIKWKKELLDIHQINVLQQSLLEKASKMVKPGGVIVYSTCSIEQEENYGIVNKFLQANSNFKLEPANGKFSPDLIDENGCIQTFPHLHKMDGAFAAKIIRTE
jgi:16S rRNA (cytosine967-C5)-methyltransferase